MTQPPPQELPSMPPRWFTMIMAAAGIMLVVITVFVSWELDTRNDDRVERCEQAAQLRSDHRLMWIELFEVFPEAAARTGLDVRLDERLPLLYCDGSTLTPVNQEATP